jgi:hypothetical protein
LKISSRSLRHGIHFLEKRSLSVSRLGDQVAELQKQVAELQAAERVALLEKDQE